MTTALAARLPIPIQPCLPDLPKNLAARAALKVLKLQGEISEEEIKQRCREDFVFWAEQYGWTHDEHAPPKLRVGNLVLWVYQKRIALKTIEEVLRCAYAHDEEWNAYGDKARKTAFTFTMLLVIQWLWQFHGISSVITSKTIEDCDTFNDMNTPMEKLRWQIERQPLFLLPDGFSTQDKEHYKKFLIAIPGGGAQIAGLAPRGKAMRQARALIWFGDEFPHTDFDSELWDAACGTVKVRIVGGTPNKERGENCKAYRLRYNRDGENCTIFTIPWWEHPVNAQGLYRKADGTLSSPWWDKQCATKSKQTLATEYLMDWNAALGAQAIYAFRDESVVFGLQPDPSGGPIYCGLDPGLHFGAVWAQRDRLNRLRILRECIMSVQDAPQGKTLLTAMAERIISTNQRHFSEYKIIYVGDPYASRQQISAQEKTEFEILASKHGIRVLSAYMYSISSDQRRKKRIEIVNELAGMNVLNHDDETTPQLLINSATCPITYEALKTKYRYVILKDTGQPDPHNPEIVRAHPFNEAIDCIGMIAIKEFDSKWNKDNSAENLEKKPRSQKPQRQTWRKTRGSRYG